MSGQNKITLIDFGTNTVCKITSQEKQELISQGFRELKSDFHKRGFSIYVTMRRKEYKFFFDMSFNQSFSMELSDGIPFFKEPHQIEESDEIKHIYENKWITINGIHYSSSIVVSQAENSSRVGIGFIQGFDWIVDWQSRKVYFRKNNIPINTENLCPKSYRAGIKEEKLVIVARNSRFKKFNVGDEIISVNAVRVTIMNLCEMAFRLSDTVDWNLIDIEVITKSN